MNNGILEIIEKYIKGILDDKYHRFSSWDNCFEVFSNSKKAEFKVLELAFYLASWGMYRGSSGLLQKNHFIHQGAVDILFSKTNQALKCNQTNEVIRENIKSILALKDELSAHYSNIYFTRGAEDPKPISPTDTLLSKIMLGTLGCVPAYDQYFIKGLKEMKMKHFGFNELSLTELFNFIDDNIKEIEQSQNLIKARMEKHYPLMKILDMYFWQIGYDKEIMEKNKENEN